MNVINKEGKNERIKEDKKEDKKKDNEEDKKENNKNDKNGDKNENKKKEIININIEKKKDENKEEEKKENQNYMENRLMRKLIEVYLELLDISIGCSFKKKIKNNKISLLLGLRLPGMRTTLSSLKIYARDELSDKFFQNEKNIKDLYPDKENEGFLKFYDLYKNRIKNEQKNMETEINKNEIFQKIIDFGKEFQEDYRQFFEWVLDDYYLLFLSEILQDIKNSFNDLEDYKNILKKMVYLRFSFGKEDNEVEVDPLKLLAMKMVWLEANSEYISLLLNIYQKISIYEKNLFNKINTIIENKEIKYKISERVPAHTEEFNSPFFYIMEAILKIIITDIDLYNNLNGQNYYDFINSLKGIAQDALRIVSELKIFSKEVFTIQQFLDIENNLYLANKSNKENILKVLEILSEHSKRTNIIICNGAKYKVIRDNIEKLNEFLKENLGNTDNYIKLILNIFVEEKKK